MHLAVLEATGIEDGQILDRTSMNLSQIAAWSPNKGRLFCSNKAIALSVQRIGKIQGSQTDLRVPFLPYDVADFGPKHLSRVHQELP